MDSRVSYKAKKLSNLPRTACFTASVRASESLRPDALFHDPFAEKLSLGMNFKSRGMNKGGSKSPLQSEDLPFVQVRTRYIDDLIMYHVRNSNIRQMVLLGAGMDARAYRLDLPQDMYVYEIDVDEIMQIKQKLLEYDVSKCHRFTISAELTMNDWTQKLINVDFDRLKPAIWIGEGFFMYISDAEVHNLLQQIDSLSADGSIIFMDVFNPTLLDILNNTTNTTTYIGVYKSGYEYPENELFGEGHLPGWRAISVQIGSEQANYNRYRKKPAPRDIIAPRTYFVTAYKTREMKQ
jgi:methyltransferase (TIGR00027 family)